jgi:hypothetical protein
MVAFLLVALVVAVGATVMQIERTLLADAQNAVATAGIPYYDLRVEGRDAVLGGFVAQGTDVQRLEAVVASVPGIRRVRNEVTVEIIKPDTPIFTDNAPPSTNTPGLPPELRVQRLGEFLMVSGRVPNDGTAGALEEALHDAFPRANLRITVAENAATAGTEWTRQVAVTVRALARLGDPARLAAYGHIVQLAGPIADSAERDRLDEILSTAPDIGWRLTLSQPSGGIGGAP